MCRALNAGLADRNDERPVGAVSDEELCSKAGFLLRNSFSEATGEAPGSGSFLGEASGEAVAGETPLDLAASALMVPRALCKALVDSIG
jgi:hypothetical protein